VLGYGVWAVWSIGVALTEISARKIYVKFIKRNKRRQQKQVATAKMGRALLAATSRHTHTHNHLDKALHS